MLPPQVVIGADQSGKVLARLERAQGQNERMLYFIPCAHTIQFGGLWPHKALLDTRIHHVDAVWGDIEQLDEILACVLRIGQQNIRPPDRAGHGTHEVGKQCGRGTRGAAHEGEVVHGEDGARAPSGGQHKVGRVQNVDAAREGLYGQGKTQPLPQDRQVAILQGKLAQTEIGRPGGLTRVAPRAEQDITIAVVQLGEGPDQAACVAAYARALAHSRGIVDADARHRISL